MNENNDDKKRSIKYLKKTYPEQTEVLEKIISIFFTKKNKDYLKEFNNSCYKSLFNSVITGTSNICIDSDEHICFLKEIKRKFCECENISKDQEVIEYIQEIFEVMIITSQLNHSDFEFENQSIDRNTYIEVARDMLSIVEFKYRQAIEGKKIFNNVIDIPDYNILLLMIGAYDFDLSIREICELLKITRKTCNDMVRSKLKSVYITKNCKKDEKNDYNIANIVKRIFDKNVCTENNNILLNRQEFCDFLNNSEITLDVKTILINLKSDIESELIDFYIKDCIKEESYIGLKEEQEYLNNLKEYPILQIIKNEVKKNNLPKVIRIKEVAEIKKLLNIETKNIFEPVSLFETFKCFLTTRDISLFGDSSEDIKNRLYMYGGFKITIEGEFGKRQYYIDASNRLVEAVEYERQLIEENKSYVYSSYYHDKLYRFNAESNNNMYVLVPYECCKNILKKNDDVVLKFYNPDKEEQILSVFKDMSIYDDLDDYNINLEDELDDFDLDVNWEENE